MNQTLVRLLLLNFRETREPCSITASWSSVSQVFGTLEIKDDQEEYMGSCWATDDGRLMIVDPQGKYSPAWADSAEFCSFDCSYENGWNIRFWLSGSQWTLFKRPE